MKKMSKNLVAGIVGVCLGAGFGGCADSIAGTAGSIAGSVTGTALTVATGGNIDGASLGSSLGESLASGAVKKLSNPMTGVTPNTKGLIQGQAIVQSLSVNPALMGVGAIANAKSEMNRRKNLQAYKNLSKTLNDPNFNANTQKGILSAFNKQNGTNINSMEELQDLAKIQGYNEQEGTNFTTLAQVREDYNKKHNTTFATDKEFRDFIASNRR